MPDSPADRSKTPYKGRRVFRTSIGYMLIFIGAGLTFLVGAVYTYRARGWTWTSAGLIAMSVLGLGGVLEGFVRRIELADDAHSRKISLPDLGQSPGNSIRAWLKRAP